MSERRHPRVNIAAYDAVDHVYERLHLNEQAILRQNDHFKEIELKFFMIMLFLSALIIWAFFVDLQLLIDSVLDVILLFVINLLKIVFVHNGLMKDINVHVFRQNS